MFPGNGKITLRTSWDGITERASRIKSVASSLVSASTITRKTVLDYANSLADSLATLDAHVVTPGLLDYARKELNDANVDLAAEFATMKTQIVATQDWIVANFPKDATNNLTVYSFDATKRYADINLTAGQLTAFKNQLSLLVGTIN